MQTLGSSPRVRGSQAYTSLKTLAHGIIPAGAGLTSDHLTRPPTHQDHPRGCGAHLPSFLSLSFMSGSSPRVRGSLIDGEEATAKEGIIPAGAGLTNVPTCSQKALRDHPRGCGAHTSTFCPDDTRLGSSPRVRGSPALEVRRSLR